MQNIIKESKVFLGNPRAPDKHRFKAKEWPKWVHFGWASVWFFLIIVNDWSGLATYKEALLLVFLMVAVALHLFGFFRSFNNLENNRFYQLFFTKQQARIVGRHVSDVLYGICGKNGQYFHNRAYYLLARHMFDDIGLSTAGTPTPAGYNGGMWERLPQDSNLTFSIIIREALHYWLGGKIFVRYEQTTCPWDEDEVYDLSHDELPAEAQAYILTFFPDLLYVNPARFSKDNLDSVKPGAHSLLTSMLNLDYTTEEAVREVLVFMKQPNGQPKIDTSNTLPPDLV